MATGSAKVHAGDLVSHYRLVELLGAGGMGVVYKADDVRLKRSVALKFLPPELIRDEAAKRRFVREAQAASALDHPNICSIHEIDETPDGQFFICMSCYEGETLDRRLKRGPLPLEEAIRVAIQVADGLACAHEHEIIHRDIKPANLMLTREGQMKILDFGLAKLRGMTRETQLGSTVGTCAYMSPEQALGTDVDARSDIFSLGIVLYELLTGHSPFNSDYEQAVVYQIMHATPKPLADFQPGMDPHLQQVIDKAMQKDAAARYQSISEFREDLQSAASGLKPRWAKLSTHYFRLAMVLTMVAALSAVAVISPRTREWIQSFITPVPDAMHVAVLPFENIGQDPVNQAFCDGLVETLSAQLTQLEQSRGSLWVVPASVVRAENVSDAGQARRALGVNLVVTGAVQRVADRLRVTLSLVDVAHGTTLRQLDSATIDNLTTRAFLLQDETVMKLAGMMSMTVLPEEHSLVKAGSTTVSTAYDFYTQGVGYVRRYETEGNLDRAISAFSMAIDRDSSYALAYAGLGEAYWRKFRDTKDAQWIELALTNGHRAVELDSLVAPPRVTLGLIWSGTGQAESAIPEFERALALEPRNAEAYRGLATAYANMQQPEKAEATYRKAIDMKPDYWGGYNDFGLFYYQQGEYEEAIAQFRRVTELNPQNKFGYLNLGACYWYSDQLDKAREMFERSLAVEPNFRAYSNLGALYYIKESYSEAAKMCQQAITLNKTDYQTWNNLANSYYWIPGKRAEAMEAYRQATQLLEERKKLAPRDPRLLASLAGYYAILGERDQALSYIDQATGVAPDNTMVLYFTGHAYEQLQQRDEAIACISKALDGNYPLSELETDPFMHELRNDVRYEQLRERGLRAQREQDEKK